MLQNASLHHALPTRSTLEWPDLFLAPSSIIIPNRGRPFRGRCGGCQTLLAHSRHLKQARNSFVLHKGKKEPHEKATHETRGNNDTPLFASCTFPSHAIYYKAKLSSPSSSSTKSPVDCIAWYRYLHPLTSLASYQSTTSSLTHHHRLASLYTSGLRGSLQNSSIHLSLDWFYLSFLRDTRSSAYFSHSLTASYSRRRLYLARLSACFPLRRSH